MSVRAPQYGRQRPRGGYRTGSYRPCECGAECDLLDDNQPREPCWGEVTAVDDWVGEDGAIGLLHACRGHRLADLAVYTPEAG